MFKYRHIPFTIRSNADAEHMRSQFYKDQTYILAGAFDTEATGLNPVLDKPFLYQFGWINTNDNTIYTFVVDIEQQPILAKQVIKVWQILAKSLPVYLGHHVIFDLHMVTNIGLPYDGDNISDTMAYIRLGTNQVQEDKGGAPLALKKFATQYIDRSAKDFEKLLSEEKKNIASNYNAQLKAAFGWTKKKIDEFFKDTLNEVEDLPKDKQAIYLNWKAGLPLYLQDKVTGAVDSDMIRYDYLNRENVIHYGHIDVQLTLEVFALLNDAIKVRKNEGALRIENANIYPLYRMERVGMHMNKAYLLECKAKTKAYIRERRRDLAKLAGENISIGQHEKIKTLLNSLGCRLTSTNNDTMEQAISDMKREGIQSDAIEIIETVQELRTLEKWYSTYICRFLYDLQHHDRVYTSVNAYGAVSGRVTCDFQQFPKKALKTIGGEELFHPRKLVEVSQGYKGIIYLDYSQVELRLQAMYTILVGHPDLNLCRAYMPYKCFTMHEEWGKIEFDYNNHWCITNAYNRQWYYNETPDKVWEALDVHGATTKAAFHIDESDPNFHDLRYVGKRVNFAKNYGAQRGKIRQMFPEFSEEQIDAINDAYYKAFPGVKEYHKYCMAIANQPCATNLFGVHYWGVSGHNLINMLVQGSGAYLLKTKINQVDAYLQKHHCKSKFFMQIHDELQFEWHPDDPPELWFQIKHILQDYEDGLVPIISDMEVTYTNWAEKVEVEDLCQLTSSLE